MPHLYRKKSGGRTYWYLREVHRVRGKVQSRGEKYLGTAETILAKIEAAERVGRPVRLKIESFGTFFVAHCLEQELDTIGIIDDIIHRARNEKGPTAGEYFFYAWANRMIDPKSKRGLVNWYRTTAVRHLRQPDSELTSERYREKWERVSSEQIEQIGKRFLKKLWAYRDQSPHRLLFDTTSSFG